MATDNSKRIAKLLKYVRVPEGSKVRLKKHDPAWTGSITDEKEASALLEEGIRRLAKQQGKLYAQDTRSLLLIFQAMDAAGKDGTIRHVMSGVNPQGCQVFNFKAPSEEELDHTYLWRSMKALPERGRIGIHNRSYYEEVLVTKVHPEILASQRLPDDLKDDGRLEAPLPRDQQLRAIPGRQWHRHPQVLPQRLQGRAEAPIPRPHRRG